MASSYEIPDFGSTGSTILGFMLEAIQEGDAWLQAQRPTTEWDAISKMLGPTPPTQDIEGMSNVGYNLVERNARDIVASLSNFRHEGEFRPEYDQALYQKAHTLTKLDRHWARVNQVYDIHRANLQNTVAFGTGYLVEDWDKRKHDVRLRAFSPNDITFVQMPKDHDIQGAYIVLIREELPLHLARRDYQNIAGALVPDREAPGWIQRGRQAVQKFLSPALRVGGIGPNNQRQGSFPTVDIFHAYVMDDSVNHSGTPVTMGAYGTNWSYKVPALGDPIPMGTINPATGNEWTRPAEDDDCRLFPLRRYTVFSRTAVAYDGSSPWWHGDVPVARTRFNDWAWQALGKSLLSDPKTMQDGIVALMRYIEDACAARLNPPVLYDDTLVSEGFAQNFNTRLAGSTAAANLNSGGDVLKFPVDSRWYDVPTGIYEWIKSQEGRIDKMMGTPDLVAMAKAKQVPGEGTLEKLMEMAGPLVQDMVHALEVPLTQLGEWRKALYFQFYPIRKVIQVNGPDDTLVDEQYTADTLLAYTPGEDVGTRQSKLKKLISEFKYRLTESGIHEMNRMINRLALLQLQKSGVPIDWWTIAKAWKLDLGPEPEGTKTMMERWVAQQHLMREMAEEAGAGQPGPQKGRPPTNVKPPQLVSKDGGSRSTVKTS